MALTQADVDRLDAAIASSELEVEVDGRRVRYRDTTSLITARDHAAAVVARSAQVSSGSTRASFHFTPVLGRER